MRNERIETSAGCAAALIAQDGIAEAVEARGRYVAECYDADGNLKWRDVIENLVVTVGKDNLLDTYLAGAAYTAAWYMGLVDGAVAPVYAAADTSAAHAGWTENTGYSNAARPTCAFSAAAAGAKALSAPLAFNINAAGTIAGCFISSLNTKGGATGTLLSEGNFTGGSRIVANGDTLNVSWSLSV